MALFSSLFIFIIINRIVSYPKIQIWNACCVAATERERAVIYTQRCGFTDQIQKEIEKKNGKIQLNLTVTQKGTIKSNMSSSWARTPWSIYLLLTYMWFDWICCCFFLLCMCDMIFFFFQMKKKTVRNLWSLF